MPADYQPTVDLLQESFSRQLRTIQRLLAYNRNLAVLLVTVTLFAAYATTAISPYVFVVFLPLLLLQSIATGYYKRYIAAVGNLYAASAGCPGFKNEISLTTAAAMAVKRTYFLLFLAFDTVWLLKPYIHPVGAVSFEEYCRRLSFGFISGRALLWFSAYFWFVYALLLVIGIYREKAVTNQLEAVAGAALHLDSAYSKTPLRVPFTVYFDSYDGSPVHLHGYRMPNRDKQPVILWPGFFQNGFVWDLEPGGISLAEYLWRSGYDLWIIHSRGTGGSGGRNLHCSMDDYAAVDIPAVIDYVSAYTGRKPVYTGHSQGGMTALVSMMGVQKDKNGNVSLSDHAARQRQDKLKGLATFGSYLNLNHSRNPWLKELVEKGVRVTIWGKKITVLTTGVLLFLCKPLRFLPMPLGMNFRHALMHHRGLRGALLPLCWILNASARMALWEFLYHIPNVTKRARDLMFYMTQDGTFYQILNQFQLTVRREAMHSYDGSIVYTDHYDRITLPVSITGMEKDVLADSVSVKTIMHAGIKSETKYFTELKGMGHEDFLMVPAYFPQALEAIEKVSKP